MSDISPIEAYEEVMAAEALLRANYLTNMQVILAPVKEQIDAAEQELADGLEELAPAKKIAEENIRRAVLTKSESIKGSVYRCEYVKSAFKLKDPVGLLGYAKEHPEVLKYFAESAPTTRLVSVR